MTKISTAAPPTKPTRRKQEDRTREAREKLLRATIDVLLECGYNRLSTKEVCNRAGLSNGALVHHFSSKSELVVAATAAVYDEAILRAQQAAESPDAIKDPVSGFVAHCASVYFDWPFIAALEVVMVARTDPELMSRINPVIRTYRTLTDQAWTEVLIRVGVTRPKAAMILSLTLNQVRGMALGDLWSVDDPTVHERALAEWSNLIKRTMMPRRA
ncbi:TetR/AcrR family transcriptional regulator [Burkholderia cepacia]|uniref:TetR/AcrR family transcriptional regulator n=1 Tax=Burkholderia cepacia TaxID=292 RepID=UPI000F5FBEFB|nr:TetR/AcrR family transcriptional regulator [Burkholderia cepacia]MCA8028957.1 TetR/AcrR family transcriptional regulator [Burkholderia cepacia]RRA20992.1 TetR/AcrR family transcriptional regulator [Burkholderia cepacia]